MEDPLKNGDLLDAAEREGFEVLITTDRNLQYQQNLNSRRDELGVSCRVEVPVGLGLATRPYRVFC